MVKRRMDKKTLRRLQEIEFELLLEVDRICRKNKIKYNICGGTLIGAARHKGFIPWDDDIDIRMLYSVYVRFKEACKIRGSTSCRILTATQSTGGAMLKY